MRPAEIIPIEPDLGHASEGRVAINTKIASSVAPRPKVAIIGAGVCGLGIGWRLAAAGCPVEVFERGRAGHGASWAAAGMLAGGVETEPGEQSLLALNRIAQARWPAFAHELAEASGIDPQYREDGTLVVAFTRDDVEALRFNYDFQSGLGIELEWLSGAEARRREPHLRPGTAAAVYSPHDHQVENRCLAAALQTAFQKAGGVLRENCAVEAIAVTKGRVDGLHVAGARVPADIVVLAAGAWSHGIAGLPPEARPPVRPVKGQMLALRMDPAAPLLRHVLWAPGIYIVPRNDGRLLVGATVEEKGFDGNLTAGGVFALIEAAWRALPTVEELPIAESWVGFRPTSRDDAPILGPCGVEGLVMATGHHRNGILLAPVTADAVSLFVLTGELLPEVAGFGMDRFAQAAKGAA